LLSPVIEATTMLAAPQPLSDLLHRHILVVEDEFMLAEDLRLELVAHGAEVVGPVAGVEDALACIARTPELAAAVLDINLQGETAYPVADHLLHRGVPFVFVTGYEQVDLPERFDGIPVLVKPAAPEAVADALLA
jgi:CheY-like chemotaxis protein